MTKSQSMIFYPNLRSRLVIQQHKSIWFCCQAEPDYIIELWSNLSLEKKWHALSFTPLQQEYQLEIDLLLPPGEYEFTFRFKTSVNTPWSWYGRHNENGQISITSTLPVTQHILPQQLCLVAKQQTNEVDLWHFRTQNNSTCLGKFNHDSFVSCIKKGSCWLTPVVNCDNEQQWQLLLYQEKGTIHLWMIVGQDGWLSPGPSNTIHLNHQGDLIIASTSNINDFYRLIQTAFNYHASSINQEVKKTRNDSIMLNKLGYCTWNAFGKSVDADKINNALDSLQRNNIPVGYIIIDDGWQMCNEKQQLVSMDACQDKFTGGLKHTVSAIKSKYPFIESVGIWHALWGYWNGVDENFSKNYGYYPSMNNNDTIGLVHDPERFYHDFYNFLNKSNIDFVKVDNQGSFQDLGMSDKISVWDKYRQAVTKQADTFFHGQVIHSMALTPHILFHSILSQNSIFRNSDDFFPNENDSHAWHIYANAINSLWTFNLVGDWDMFQSDHLFAEYHASSRAISGGPIYITDEPNKHSTTLLYRLIGQTRHHGYSILRSKQAPQPTFDTVFGNPMKHETILGLCNFHGEYNVRGFWNTSQYDELSIVTTDIYRTVAYVVSGADEGKLRLLCSNSIFCVRVKGLASSLVSISPIHLLGTFSVACLGLIDKFNGTNAIFQTTSNDDYKVLLTHRGCCGFWMDKKPERVMLDNQLVNIDWNEKIGLLKIDMMVVPLHVTTDDLFCIRITII